MFKFQIWSMEIPHLDIYLNWDFFRKFNCFDCHRKPNNWGKSGLLLLYCINLKDTFQIIDMYKFIVPDLTYFEVSSKSHFPMCHFLSSKYFLVNWSFEQFLIFKHVIFFRKFLKELNSIGIWIINFCTLSKVQKILRNGTMSENTFQSFNIKVYEKFFF